VQEPHVFAIDGRVEDGCRGDYRSTDHSTVHGWLFSQFLVWCNSGMTNPVSFVGIQYHTTFKWSWALPIFATGSPFGAAAAWKIVDSRDVSGW